MAYLKLAFFLLVLIVDSILTYGLKYMIKVSYWYALVLTVSRNLRMAFFMIAISDYTFLGIRTVSRLSPLKITRLDALLTYIFTIVVGVVILLEFVSYCRLVVDESYVEHLRRIEREKRKRNNSTSSLKREKS